MKNHQKLIILAAIFCGAYFIPFNNWTIFGPAKEALLLLQEYAREHVLLCLIPAFFIAGAVATLIEKNSVIRYLGEKANKIVSYSVAAISGTILAVCSCTVLPLFTGIYKRGAGIGPATAFLYSGPAINILAIIMTARILGPQMGIARAVGAILFSVIIGLFMQTLFKNKKEDTSSEEQKITLEQEVEHRPLWKTGLYFFSMIAILVLLNWKKADNISLWNSIYQYKFLLLILFSVGLLYIIFAWFKTKELNKWLKSTLRFSLQILPLLFIGILVSGFLLGRPGHQGIIPSSWIKSAVGGNSLAANFFAAISGSLMYFATLTEVPILQGLLNSGMGQGPALALLLAGPALSLPSMLVIRSVLGTKKTVAYISLVIIMATISGVVYGVLTA